MLQCVFGFHLEQLQQNSVLLFSPFNFINKKQSLKCFRDLFEIKHTFFFLFMHVTLTKHHNLRNWYLLFYNRTGSNKIHAWSIFFFFFLVYLVDYFKVHIQTNFNAFQTTGVIFTSIISRERRSVKQQVKMLGMIKKKKNKLNQTTLIEFAKLQLLSDSATIL